MSLRFLAVSAFAAATLVAWAQAPPPSGSRQRDLKFEKDDAKVAEKPVVAATSGNVAIPRSYALVIGVAGYPKLPARGQLQFSERDAELVYSVLISSEGGNFKAENVHKLIGPKATLANIRKELETWLPSVSQEGDRVLVYFAGHGFTYAGKGYLAPADLDPNNIAGTGYPMDELGRVIGSKIKARWKVLLTDSCHSGAITPEDDPEQVSKNLQELTPSLFSLTASRARERSYESPQWGGGQGAFSYFVVKGMQGEADENHDGRVTADELAEYVHRNVREQTGGQQNPTSDRGNFDSEMLLAYIPNGAITGNRPAPKDGTLIFTANMDDVEVFVDGKSYGVISSKGQSLTIPGLQPGPHTIQGQRRGYEPDGPRQEVVYPGQQSTVTLKFSVQARRNKAAVDQLQKGLEYYNRGFKANYEKAKEYFTEALRIDPKYAEAALYLGRTEQLLYQFDDAKKYFEQALEIDPEYVEARASYGGMLLDQGNSDESYRQLNRAVQRDPKNELALSLLAEAAFQKEMYAECVDYARRAIQLAPNHSETHLWLADGLRNQKQWAEALQEYQKYLQLSDFDSGVAGKLNYYVLGSLIGFGKKRRATTADFWQQLRGQAYYGMCETQRKLNQYEASIASCQKSLAYDRSDALAHYELALSLARQAQKDNSLEVLAAASRHMHAMLEINPDLDQAKDAKKMLANWDPLLQQSH